MRDTLVIDVVVHPYKIAGVSDGDDDQWIWVPLFCANLRNATASWTPVHFLSGNQGQLDAYSNEMEW